MAGVPTYRSSPLKPSTPSGPSTELGSPYTEPFTFLGLSSDESFGDFSPVSLSDTAPPLQAVSPSPLADPTPMSQENPQPPTALSIPEEKQSQTQSQTQSYFSPSDHSLTPKVTPQAHRPAQMHDRRSSYIPSPVPDSGQQTPSTTPRNTYSNMPGGRYRSSVCYTPSHLQSRLQAQSDTVPFSPPHLPRSNTDLPGHSLVPNPKKQAAVPQMPQPVRAQSMAGTTAESFAAEANQLNNIQSFSYSPSTYSYGYNTNTNTNVDRSNPPGYIQNTRDSFNDRINPFAPHTLHPNTTSTSTLTGILPTSSTPNGLYSDASTTGYGGIQFKTPFPPVHRRGSGILDNDPSIYLPRSEGQTSNEDGMWQTASRWARAASQRLSAGEQQIWRFVSDLRSE